MDINVRFCRILLQRAMKDLTGREAEHFRENAAVMKISGSRGDWLFEWSNADTVAGRTFTLELQADNAADAKAKGINEWLESHAVALRALDWPPRELFK